MATPYKMMAVCHAALNPKRSAKRHRRQHYIEFSWQCQHQPQANLGALLLSMRLNYYPLLDVEI